MSDDGVAGILKQYDAERARLAQFRRKAEQLVKELLAAKGHRVHSVSSRVKDRSSLERKVQSAGRRYVTLADVTDIVGVRIITLFDDQVDEVAEVVEREFQIDGQKSDDRRKVIDPDRFGYLSVHYVARLSPQRGNLPEYVQYADCVAEIQVRSIVQHVWAEIHHDLGYKSREGIPRDFERGFARVASILEVADAEFVRLREGLRKYEADVGAQISASPESVEINQASLLSFITTNAEVERLDGRIAERLNEPPSTFVARCARGLRYLGLRTITDVESNIRTHGDALVGLALEQNHGRMKEAGARGGSLVYLGDVLALRGDSEKEYFRYLREGLDLDEWSIDEAWGGTIDAYRRMKAEETGASDSGKAAG